MVVFETVERSVLVCGTCSEWLPLVVDFLRSNGFYDVSVDTPSQRLTAAYSGGSASVSLYPSADGLKSLISVTVTPYSVGGDLAC